MSFFNIFKNNNKKHSNIDDDIEIREEIIENTYNYNYDYDFINEANEVRNIIEAEMLNIVKTKGRFNELKISAEVAKDNIGLKNVDFLKEYLGKEIEKPKELGNKYKTDIEWKVAIQNAVLIIIYSYKEDSIEILSKIAYESDTLNLKAINLLIKLSIEGIAQERIVDDIMNNIVNFNDDDKITILGFMSQIKNNNKVIAITQYFFKEFLNNKDVEGAYEVLIHLINAAGRSTQGHLNFLKGLSVEDNSIDLKKVMIVKDGDQEFVNIENIDEIVRIKAALTFYNYNTKDPGVNNNLRYWSENYKDKEVRDEIIRLLAVKN